MSRLKRLIHEIHRRSHSSQPAPREDYDVIARCGAQVFGGLGHSQVEIARERNTMRKCLAVSTVVVLAACGGEISEPTPVATVSVTPAESNLVEGDSVQLTAVVRDAAGNAMTGRSVNWSSSSNSIAWVDGNGLVVAGQVSGEAVISATSEGVVGTARVSVVRNEAPVVTLLSPSNYAISIRGVPVNFQAIASDPEDGSLPDSAFTWKSDINGYLGSGAVVMRSDLAPGLHLIKVTAVDGRGKRAHEEVSIRIVRESIGNAFVQGYQDEFGLSIPRPAIVRSLYGDPSDPYDHSHISVAYIHSTIYRLYLYSDGRVESRTSTIQRPVGEFRVVVVAVNYANTNIAQVLHNEWVVAQEDINARHRAFAEEQGLSTPLVRFWNTNVLADPAEIPDPTNRADVVAFLASHGIPESQFDIVVSLDLNTLRAGGFATGDFVYMGCFFCMGVSEDFDAGELEGIALAVYWHEVAHLWGWEHGWTNSCFHGYPELCHGFITRPELFGWVDTDGDGVPEILDETPYGTQ